MTVRDKIIGLYDQHVFRRSVLSIRDGESVFRQIMGDGQYRHALEIGTYRGVSAAVLAHFCKTVTTIDLHHGRMEQLGETWDRKAFWAAMGIDNIELILVDDDAEKARRIAPLHFDFAFIDGAHDDASVKRDFMLVRRCGAVLFHDYDRRGVPGQDCVADFVDSLPKSQIEVMDIFALWRAPRG